MYSLFGTGSTNPKCQELKKQHDECLKQPYTDPNPNSSKSFMSGFFSSEKKEEPKKEEPKQQVGGRKSKRSKKSKKTKRTKKTKKSKTQRRH
jgi:hypothetical protein